MSFGPMGGLEGLTVIPMMLISLGVPIAAFVLLCLIYGKVKRIEEKLAASET